ncbi:MAG: chloride channel protein [Acidimicrobiales bacterium]
MAGRLNPHRRLLLLTVLAAGVGLVAGGAAWVLLKLIGLITNLALFHRLGWKAPPFTQLHRSPWVVVAAVVGGLLVSLLAKWSPVIRGHGIPEAMEAILTKQSRIQPRTAIAKPLSAAISIGTAGPFGAEGPIIVTGGALGSLVGQVVAVTSSERKILLASGAAAGMAATFGTPLAAAVLAVELLLFEFSRRALIPVIVASAVAGGVHATLFGSGPFFAVPDHQFAGLGTLPIFAVLGLFAGLLAVVVAEGLFIVEHAYRRLPVSEFWHPVIGAVAFASVGLIEPRALGVGYDAITDVLGNRLALGTIAVLATVKLVAWWLALGSGTSGGTLAPILLISAGYGSLFGAGANHLLPHLGVSQGAFALVAMAAVFGAATRATLTSMIFVFELTGDYNAILPLMLATVLAELVANNLLRESLMTEKLARRGLRVHADYEVDVLRTHTVGELMTVHPAPRPNDEIDDATVHLGEIALDAVRRMLDEGVERFSVVNDDNAVVGVCTLNDILKARANRFDHETLQHGWLPPMLTRWQDNDD